MLCIDVAGCVRLILIPSDEENAGEVICRAWRLWEENESPQMDGVATGQAFLQPQLLAGNKGGDEEDFLIL